MTDAMKKAIDDAGDGCAALSHFIQTLAVDVRNVRFDIQAHNHVDLKKLAEDGKQLRERCDKALAAYRGLYDTARKHYGKGKARG